MSIQESIIIGVVSGIITSALLFLCVTIFNKIVIPWYRATIFSGIDISGTWEETVIHQDVTDHFTIELSQKNCEVTGILTVVKTENKTETIHTKTLVINGRFQNAHLLLTMTNQDRKFQSLITYLLQISKGGTSLMGQASWVDIETEQIHSREAVLNRLNV